MKESSLQVGKTRYTHYALANHLIWIPKYRRRVLVGEVQVETKRLIAACLAGKVSSSQKDVRKGASLDKFILRRDGWRGFSRDHQTVHPRKSGRVVPSDEGHFHPTP